MDNGFRVGLARIDGWHKWEECRPPDDEIVECFRLGEEADLSFWVLPSLVSPFWNVEGVFWKITCAGAH